MGIQESTPFMIHFLFSAAFRDSSCLEPNEKCAVPRAVQAAAMMAACPRAAVSYRTLFRGTSLPLLCMARVREAGTLFLSFSTFFSSSSSPLLRGWFAIVVQWCCSSAPHENVSAQSLLWSFQFASALTWCSETHCSCQWSCLLLFVTSRVAFPDEDRCTCVVLYVVVRTKYHCSNRCKFWWYGAVHVVWGSFFDILNKAAAFERALSAGFLNPKKITSILVLGIVLAVSSENLSSSLVEGTIASGIRHQLLCN